MGRLIRSRLKMALNMKRDSYFVLVTCTSLVLYAICLYTFLHVNGYVGSQLVHKESTMPRVYSQEYLSKIQSEQQKRSVAPYIKSQSFFDDGKIHQFQRNAAQPVDWDMQVKAQGIRDIAQYLRSEREKREKVQLILEQQKPFMEKRGPPKMEHRKLLSFSDDDEPSWIRSRAALAAPLTAALAENSSHTNQTKEPLFPPDLFTREERQHGAVILHIAGVIYMFVALAIVCDEFFVPSLDVIIEKLDIPDDVAGATFMAAGGSAPELFTSVIGVFVSFDDVGIGTIVGSAVFNILFVIGMCALFSKTVLSLTWWPLFRDCSFYSLSLITLVLFFLDEAIYWWEAALLLSIYAAYVSFMKWNEQVERVVKRFLYRNTMPRISSTDHLVTHSTRGPPSQASVSSNSGCGSTATTSIYPPIGPNGNSGGRTGSAGLRGTKFRHGLLQLMIHSIDPMHDGGHVDDKANNLHAIASLRVLLDATKAQAQGQGQSLPNGREPTEETGGCPPDLTPVESIMNSDSVTMKADGNNAVTIDTHVDEAADTVEEVESSKPLDLSWPQTTRKQITYILLAPILYPLWLTLPDTRTPQGKRLFPLTFIGSIVWIATFSYFMVWWANLTGETVNIPPEVMGLTFLAAGTSIPDLITSVIVARKGLGDMAVSSSVGSNIFDVCVGLPLPWLLYGIIMGGPVHVSSTGMACSILILFGMLIFVVMSIACFRWKMNKPLGVTMFLFYFVFVALSLGFEYKYMRCPF